MLLPPRLPHSARQRDGHGLLPAVQRHLQARSSDFQGVWVTMAKRLGGGLANLTCMLVPLRGFHHVSGSFLFYLKKVRQLQSFQKAVC
jgi:hypothetical protein